jgi:protease IV
METSPNPPEFVPPPPTLPPPPAITPPTAPKPRRRWGWMIAAIILLVLLLFSLFGNLLQFGINALNVDHGFQNLSGREVGPKLEECILKDNDSRNKIAVVRLEGVITGQSVDQTGNTMVDVIKAQLKRAAADDRVKAVILKVNSPGGEVLASDEINRAVTKFQHDSHKPVICSMGSLDASGGYYISVASRWIVANDLTLTGSIGVIMEGLNFRGLMDKVGVRPMVYKSGEYKDMFSGLRATNEIPAGEHALMQHLIMETYSRFTNVVVTGRSAAHALNKDDGRALAPDWADYADGRVLSGSQALKLGLADQLGYFDDAVKKAQELANIHNANLIEYRERYDISDFLSMFGQSGQSSQARDIKLDLGIETPKLQAGERYFLWLPPAD